MKKVTFDGEIELNGKRLAINTNAQLKQGCFVEMLAQIHSQLSAMQSHHGKVFVFMMVFHVHDYSETNYLFSRFMGKLKKRLVQKYGFCRVGHVWTREHGKGAAQHYHLGLFLDGSVIQYPQKIFELCAVIWEGWNQPRPIFNPKRCYYMLKRGDDQTYREAFKHLSYFAKTRTKGNRPPSTNDYSTSRIKTK